MKKYKINIEEKMIRNIEVIIETDEDIEHILDKADSMRACQYDDYVYNIEYMGVKIIGIDEGEPDIQEVECNDLIELKPSVNS